MNILLKVKKIGNHWYPNLKHDNLDDLSIDEKFEKILTILDKENKGELEFLIYEVHTWLNETTIEFNDEDMWRWINTADAFDLRIYLHDYEYTVSSSIIDLLEDQYSMAFYNTLYSIELSSM